MCEEKDRADREHASQIERLAQQAAQAHAQSEEQRRTACRAEEEHAAQLRLVMQKSALSERFSAQLETEKADLQAQSNTLRASSQAAATQLAVGIKEMATVLATLWGSLTRNVCDNKAISMHLDWLEAKRQALVDRTSVVGAAAEQLRIAPLDVPEADASASSLDDRVCQ